MAVWTASAAGERMAKAEFELLRRGAAEIAQEGQCRDAETDRKAEPRGTHRHGAILPGILLRAVVNRASPRTRL